jgi:4-hydroxybenzoate polyprenyltransferase
MKYLQILRPMHWTKNIFVFAALIFGRKLGEPLAVGRAAGAFVCFCLAASAIYILNDIIDRKTDLLHPEKGKRPIAAGIVPAGTAFMISALCAAAAIIVAFLLASNLAITILAYFVLMFLYSIAFKKMMILDCIVIAVGFCLRAIAGVVVLQPIYKEVFISPWLIICTFALCLFMAFGKRRSEIAMLGEGSETFRLTLAGYTPELLAHMLDVTSGLAVVCFLLYAMDERTKILFGSNNLVYTTPVVLYCVFRFSALIQKGKFSGPVELIISDLPFQAGFVIWALLCIGIIYADKLFGAGGT